MTALLGILGQIWPFLLAGLGVVYGLFAGQRAKAAKAHAEQKVAEAETRVAQTEATAAKANETAAQAGADAAQERTNVENKVAAGQPGESARILRDHWSR